MELAYSPISSPELLVEICMSGCFHFVSDVLVASALFPLERSVLLRPGISLSLRVQNLSVRAAFHLEERQSQCPASLLYLWA